MLSMIFRLSLSYCPGPTIEGAGGQLKGRRLAIDDLHLVTVAKGVISPDPLSTEARRTAPEPCAAASLAELVMDGVRGVEDGRRRVQGDRIALDLSSPAEEHAHEPGEAEHLVA